MKDALDCVSPCFVIASAFIWGVILSLKSAGMPPRVLVSALLSSSL